MFAFPPIIRRFFSAGFGMVVLAAALLACSLTSSNEETTPPATEAAAYPAAAYPVAVYPPPAFLPTPQPYPDNPPATLSPVLTATPLTSSTLTPATTLTRNVFLPLLDVEATSTSTATPLPPTATPFPIDFASTRADLQANGQDLAFVKIGFHMTLPDERQILHNWISTMDAAGVPVFLKAVDNAESLYYTQQLMEASGVPHTLVYRHVGDVPFYDLPPAQAALIHWELHRNAFPPELDPSKVWLETINEVDKNRSEWLAEFAIETANLAMAEGFRWAAFGWSAGEPEPEQWQGPKMLEFLRLVGEHPDQLAIALHEGSGTLDDITHEYPHRTGRFLDLFRICDENGIPRPTVLITEFGWVYDRVPEPEQAIQDIRWAAALYAPFPQVKGAAIWNIGGGCCSGDIYEQAIKLIDPVLQYSLNNYFVVPLPPNQASLNADLYLP